MNLPVLRRRTKLGLPDTASSAADIELREFVKLCRGRGACGPRSGTWPEYRRMMPSEPRRPGFSCPVRHNEEISCVLFPDEGVQMVQPPSMAMPAGGGRCAARIDAESRRSLRACRAAIAGGIKAARAVS